MAKTEKRRLREEAERRIGALSAAERAERSETACRRLMRAPELQSAATVAAYATLDDELDVWPVIRVLAQSGRRILLPRCLPATRHMVCIEIHDFGKLAPGTFDILEPTSGDVVHVAEVDVVLTPGRAFDHNGNRVGRGAGYYDRFFLTPGCRAFKCGVAFDCQVFAAVPFNELDVPVDAVATESAFFRNHRSAAT